MIAFLAVLTGTLVAAGTWLALQGRLLHLVLGIALIGHGANLLVFAAGGAHAAPAFAPAGTPLPGAADPLPQALILTAIVIGFGATAFLLALAWRAWREVGDDDLASWRSSEPDPDGGDAPAEDRAARPDGGGDAGAAAHRPAEDRR